VARIELNRLHHSYRELVGTVTTLLLPPFLPLAGAD